MSTEPRRTTKKKTKRRDGDPVLVYKDGRLWYWTGGRPGEGKRVPERCGGSYEAAVERAAELRVRLARANGLGAHAAGTLDEAMQDMLHAMRAAGDPEGSIRQYKSNWNKWVPAKIGTTRCLDVDIKQWSAIFDNANAAGASASTVRNVARTLGVVTEWTVDRGYFASSEPFGDPRRRKKIVKRARKRARIVKAEAKSRYLLKTCPALSDIEKYAAAFEEVYPGYGYRLVLLAFATGLRINELLALRHDSIDLATGDVHVDHQLDRYQAWPARRLPKGGKTRVAFLWTCYEDVASSLIKDSLALAEDDEHHGWLFPRHRSVKGWADQAGKLAGEAKKACDWDWTFHWLRHAYATYSMASTTSGGFALDPVSVQGWLGHERLSTTHDMYVERQRDDVELARTRTTAPPGSAR